jgi:hypothetical protein
MKPQEIVQAIETKTIEFRDAIDVEKSNREVIDLYYEIKKLKLQLLQLN